MTNILSQDSKTVIIVLYGPMAAGKLTVGRILSAKLGFKLSHNHLINDLARSVYERDSLEGNRMVEELRRFFYEEVAKSKINLIITHTYAHDYVSPTGQSDPDYMREIEIIFEKYDTRVNFVHMKASDEILLSRVDNESRKEFKKLTDKRTMAELLKSEDFNTTAPVKNNLEIDTSDLTAEETAEMIIARLSLLGQ